MTEREWREAIDMRSSGVSLGLVLVVAALLRFWDLRHALVTARELLLIDPVVHLLQAGSYHPPAITRPGLPVFVYAAVSIAHFIWGALGGAWRSAGEFGGVQVVTWGRGFSALLGVAVVVLVYQVGMRWGARHALLAAGLIAVMPTHVTASREIADGALVAFFSTLTLLLSLAGVERPTRTKFATAGVTAGLAAASAYPAALVLIVPLNAAWMTRSDEGPRGWRAVAAVAGAVIAFVCMTPQVVTDLPAFLNGVGEAATPGPSFVMSRLHVAGQLLAALQWPGLILAVAGLVLGVVRAINGPGHTRWTVLVTFPVIYFVMVEWHGATSDTILLPILPAMAVLAANAVISGVSLLRRFDIPRAARTALIAGLTVAAVLPPLVVSIDSVRESMAGTDR